MKIYLDIDETLVSNDVFDVNPANYLKEFLTYVLNNHDVYWLTTHCNGDTSVPVNYLSRHLDGELIELIKKIKPTSWDMRKIEAIDLGENFLWFDDVLMSTEERELQEAGKLGSYVKVDLKNNPDFFKDYLNI